MENIIQTSHLIEAVRIENRCKRSESLHSEGEVFFGLLDRTGKKDDNDP